MPAARLFRQSVFAPVLLACCCTTMPVRAWDCVSFFDDGSVALVGCPDPAGVGEPAVPIGGWFELIKRPGSEWFPDSPSVRVEIVAASCPAGCLGIQGFLAASDNANDDSLTVWLEWIGAPAIIPAGTVVSVDLLVTAFGDAELTAGQIAAFVPVLLGEDADPQHVDWSDINCDGLADGEDIQFFLDAVAGM